MLKGCIDLLAPFITYLFNLSLTRASVPASWKFSIIAPILKKEWLDPSLPSSYRPIAKLNTLSKVLERIISMQLRSHLTVNNLFPPLQSAYRLRHSTETSMIKLTSDLLHTLDRGERGLLASLDMSAAFDCINHQVLIHRFQLSFGLSGRAWDWITSFVSGRSQSIRIGSSQSPVSTVHRGVPQGSVLGPLLFILYVSDVVQVVLDHGLNVLMFADDIQIYGACMPPSTEVLSLRLTNCLDDLIRWFHANNLILNERKTELIWFQSRRCRLPVPDSLIRIGNSLLRPVSTVCCLGVHLDSELSFNSHITKRVASCFAIMRQIRSIRSSLPRPVLQIVVSSLVISRLDYCLSILHGLPTCQLSRLQSVLNCAARLIFNASKYCAITPLLNELRWLPVKERINYRLTMLTFSCINKMAPEYLANDFQLVTSIPGRCRLRSADTSMLLVPSARRPTFGGRSFFVAGPRTWNSLPVHIRNVTCLHSFQSCLKEHFINSVSK